MSVTTAKLPHTLRAASHSGIALMENRKSLGVPREVFAPLARFSVRTLASYEKEEVLPASAQRPVSEAMRLLVALNELVEEEKDLRRWLETENSAFGDRPPLEVIRSGESDLLWEMIYQIRSGAFA